MPIADIGKVAHDHGVLFLVDAAQTAGVLPIDMEQCFIDVLCVPGHKASWDLQERAPCLLEKALW